MRNKLDLDYIQSICEPGAYYDTLSMKPQIAVHELCRYFLGDDWYDESGVTNTEQVNTNIVAAIEQEYKGAKLGWFKRQRFDSNHVYALTDHEGWNDCILSPPMKAQIAVNELCRYFLGNNWYNVISGSVYGTDLMNYRIVCIIESKYKGAKIKRKNKQRVNMIWI